MRVGMLLESSSILCGRDHRHSVASGLSRNLSKPRYAKCGNAQLNSHFITPRSNDPSEGRAHTPWQLVIGRPLNAVSDPDFQDVPENLIYRYKNAQQLIGYSWSWRYLHNHLESPVV